MPRTGKRYRMRYSIDQQDFLTYLVCEFGPDEQINKQALAEFAGHDVQGMAQAFASVQNGALCLRFNITGKIPAVKYFRNSVTRHQTLSVFKNVLEAIYSAEECLSDVGSISLLPETVMINPQNNQVVLIYLPTMEKKDINAEFAAFAKSTISTLLLADGEDMSFIPEIIKYINNDPSYNVDNMLEKILRMLSGLDTPASAPAPAPAPAPVAEAPASLAEEPATMAPQFNTMAPPAAPANDGWGAPADNAWGAPAAAPAPEAPKFDIPAAPAAPAAPAKSEAKRS